MHDFLLAKEIVDKLLEIAKEKKLSKITKASVEIGQIALAHDGHKEHVEDISIENLKFGIEAILKGTPAENAQLKISKIQGEHWKLTEIAGE
jgi:Zn finger protein HypA/HybF involved in hydrogenase expression